MVKEFEKVRFTHDPLKRVGLKYLGWLGVSLVWFAQGPIRSDLKARRSDRSWVLWSSCFDGLEWSQIFVQPDFGCLI